MKVPAPIEPAVEWVVRRNALRQAVAERDRRGQEQNAAIDLSRLLMEVAHRVAEPAEPLPRGSRPAVLLDLYRSAVKWALRSQDDGTERPLAELWDRMPAERMRAAAGDDAGAAAARGLLLSQPGSASLEVLDSSVGLVRTFAEGLLRELEAPDRRVERIRRQRWTRLALIAAVLGAIALGAPYALRGPDLARKRPFELSSVYGGCDRPGKCEKLMFHTNAEANPWVTIDLGAEETVRSVEIENRTDCCSERSVPLVVELSRDNRDFDRVARRDANFTDWTAEFKPKTARYVRLRSLHTTSLHFENVTVR